MPVEKTPAYFELNRALFDWITWGTWDKEDFTFLYDCAKNVTHLVGPQKRMQYTGERFEGAFLGVADQGGAIHYMMQASGEPAQYWALTASTLGGSPTRIDIQMTVELDGCDGDFFQWVIALRAAGVKCHLVQSSGGDTIYIGSRTSQRFWRIYCKQKMPGGCLVRYEMEVKGKLLDALWEKAGSIGSGWQVRFFAAEFRRLQEKTKRLLPASGHVEFHTRNPIADIVLSRPESVTMRWLRTTVDSSIRKAANDHDTKDAVLGWLSELLESITI